MLGLSGRNLTDPPYMINNAAGGLSNKTLHTDLIHYNGLTEYDTHNMYGSMMSTASQEAMLSRRPGLRTLVITRSTFLGAGTHVGHWTGDNVSSWAQYLISIADMLNFASIFQIPMVGSDVCGFAGNTTETLCARWMMLGAFNPFYRNHNADNSISQEAYLWPTVTQAARNAIDIRYRLLDYFYTAFYNQTATGKPVLNPLVYLYPTDSNTFGIDTQFFFGDAVLVSPVTEENSTNVEIYLPDDIFYDWNNGFKPVRGVGAKTTLSNIGFTTLPLHIRGGYIIPLRAESANTTTELRKKPFQILVAPGLDGTANGSLYIDEGTLVDQPSTTLINFTYSNGGFSMTGNYHYPANVSIESVVILGLPNDPQGVSMNGAFGANWNYNTTTQSVTILTNMSLTTDAQLQLTTVDNFTGSSGRISPSVMVHVPVVLAVLIGLMW